MTNRLYAFDTIRMTMSRGFTERHEKGVRYIHTVPLEMKKNKLYDHKFSLLEVSKINDPEFEVKVHTWDQVMNFEKRHCSCFVHDVEKFLFHFSVHAIADAKAENQRKNDYVDEFFSNERCILTVIVV